MFSRSQNLYFGPLKTYTIYQSLEPAEIEYFSRFQTRTYFYHMSCNCMLVFHPDRYARKHVHIFTIHRSMQSKLREADARLHKMHACALAFTELSDTLVCCFVLSVHLCTSIHTVLGHTRLFRLVHKLSNIAEGHTPPPSPTPPCPQIREYWPCLGSRVSSCT